MEIAGGYVHELRIAGDAVGALGHATFEIAARIGRRTAIGEEPGKVGLSLEPVREVIV